MCGKILSAFLLSAALVSTASAQTSPSLPFTLSPETTVITTPLLPDGMPDYITFLRERHGKNIDPSTNALIPLLQMRSLETDSTWKERSPELRARFLDALGSYKRPADAPTFEAYTGFLSRQKIELPNPGNELIFAATHVWNSDGHAVLEDYLQSQSKCLDLLLQASKCTTFYVPRLSKDGHLNDSLSLDINTGMANLPLAWSARCTLRAGAGEIDAALAEIAAMRKLARMIPTDTPIGNLLGALWDERACQSAAGILSSGKLTADQCATARKLLDAPPLSTIAGQDRITVEMLQRLDVIMLHVAGKLDWPKTPVTDLLRTIEVKAVKWDEVLRQLILGYDKQRAVLATPGVAAMETAADAFSREQSVLWKSNLDGIKTLARHDGESEPDYTSRITRYFLLNGPLHPGIIKDLAKYEQRRRDSALRADMLKFFIAAAEFNARNGHWPATAADLQTLPALPPDPYSANKDDRITWEIIDKTPSLFSPGPDHKPRTPDDITLGYDPRTNDLP